MIFCVSIYRKFLTNEKRMFHKYPFHFLLNIDFKLLILLIIDIKQINVH